MKPEAFPPLAPLQSLVWRLIAAPEGVGPGAGTLLREGVLRDADLSFLIAPKDHMSAVEQLDVYADMYFYRLRDCLVEDFPVLAAALGETGWHNLVTDYLLARPSRHFSLRELGRALPDFLSEHLLAEAGAELADLARLEWARVDVFDESDTQPLTREALVAHAGNENAALRLIPAARLLSLAPETLLHWRRHHEDAGAEAETGSSTRSRTPTLVWRKGFGVLHRSLPQDEARCLAALQGRDTPLADLGEIVAQEERTEAAAAERLAALIGRWTEDAVLRAG